MDWGDVYNLQKLKRLSDCGLQWKTSACFVWSDSESSSYCLELQEINGRSVNICKRVAWIGSTVRGNFYEICANITLQIYS